MLLVTRTMHMHFSTLYYLPPLLYGSGSFLIAVDVDTDKGGLKLNTA